MLTDECICGTCIPCRRAMKAMEREIQEARPKVERTGLSPEARAILEEIERETPPVKKIPTVKAVYSGVPSGSRSNEARAQRRAERVEIDGRLVHPNAEHGTPTGYRYWYCRCEKCVSRNTELQKGYHERRKQRA